MLENPTDSGSRIYTTDLDLLDEIKNFARQHFNNSQMSHAWDHTLRVHRLCEVIGPKEGADMCVLLAAAYLHDIGRAGQDASNGAVCHAREGARIARPFIWGLPISRDCKENIVHCIKAHRFRGHLEPNTIEAKILFDADKLDAIGAIGIARAYLFAGEIGARLHAPDVTIEDSHLYSENDTGFREYQVKLRNIRDRMLTKEGRRLADDRHVFMENFFKQFIKEYEGER
jgi:uncharacterized protein